jgi:DNA-binding transcriptional ArsR family regulator
MRGHRPLNLTAAAARFKVLSERARLRILECLRHGRRHVGALEQATGLRQANLSKHLQLLHAQGLVVRSREGSFIFYRIADPRVFALCDLVCGLVEGPAGGRDMRVRRRAS